MFPNYSFHSFSNSDLQWPPMIQQHSPTCPRCDSPNTKFCYYNNYCLTQPRYLCKTCRRYWTKGGSLRNIPVGGGCRKSRHRNSVKLNSTIPASPSSLPTSFRPDEAIETMAGGKGGSLMLEQSLEKQSRAEIGEETELRSNYVEKRLMEEEDWFLKGEILEVEGRRGVVDCNDNYLMSLNDYDLETALMWEYEKPF